MDESTKALRRHPLVVAWIKAYQGDDKYRTHPDCKTCGFPHSPSIYCAGTFGELRIGKDIYYVDQSTVGFFVSFREKPREGFHWKHDVWFNVKSDCVEVTSYWRYNSLPQEQVWRIPLNEWESIVESVKSQRVSLDNEMV